MLRSDLEIVDFYLTQKGVPEKVLEVWNRIYKESAEALKPPDNTGSPKLDSATVEWFREYVCERQDDLPYLADELRKVLEFIDSVQLRAGA